MFNFLTRKIFFACLTLLGLTSICFFLLRLLPGNPFDEGHVLNQEIINKLEHKYGLDLPIPEQYLHYMQKLILNGDLGPSLKYTNRDVIDILANAAPISFQLGLCAFVLASITGIAVGVMMALNTNKKIFTVLTSVAISMPSFIFAAILVGLLGLKLNWLPVALWEGPQYIILPVITLAIAPSAYIARITESSLRENLSRNHIKAVQAKGLDEMTILYKHVFYNSLLPILTIMGPLFAMLITGSFVVEFIYSIPGMGKYFITAFINRDYFLVSGTTLVFSAILLISNLIIDILMYSIDPRLKHKLLIK